MDETAIASPVPQESDSFLTRALGVFISPGQTFASIVRRPGYIAPLVVAIVDAIAITETMLAKIGTARIVRNSLELSGRASQMSAEDLQQAVHRGAALAGIIARIGEVVGAPIYLLIVAALGLFIVNVIFGASTTFKVDFAVVCYAYLVSVIGVVLALVLILFGDTEQFNPQNFVPSNVGFFLNAHETSRPLYAIASSFDIFTAWFLILTSIGLSIASARKARTVPIFLAFAGLWVLWVLAKAGLSLLSS